MLTIDKMVLTMPAQQVKQSDDSYTSWSFKKQIEEQQSIKKYGWEEGLMISDFDNFMGRNNPIVNFSYDFQL